MTRDQLIASVAESIMNGTLMNRVVNLAMILRERTKPLIDATDTAMLIICDREMRMDILARVEREARELVIYWLTYDPRGVRVIDEAMEEEHATE